MSRNVGSFLLFACCVVPLHAGFVGSTCVGDLTVCENFAQNTSMTQGSTTYTYANFFTGAYVLGKPTLGTFDQMTVADPNGVPTTNPRVNSSANMTYTDTVNIGGVVAANYAFNFDLHVINSLNYYPLGFDYVFTSLTFNVFGRDQFGTVLWATSNVSFQPVTMSQQGGATQSVTYNTGPVFYNALTASMDLQLTLSSNVWYSNYNYLTYPLPGRTFATQVTAFSDASNTLSLQSIVGQDSVGGAPAGGGLTSANGAYYGIGVATTPEPGSLGLALCGALALIIRRRRK